MKPDSIDSIVDALSSLEKIGQGNDSVVYKAPDGSTVIRNYSRLKRRLSGWKIFSTLATINILKRYFKDTEEVADLMENADGFPKTYHTDSGDITLKCKIVRHGNLVKQNGRIYAEGQKYVPKGFDMYNISDTNIELALSDYTYHLRKFIKEKLNKEYSISEFNYSLTKEGSTYTLWVTDLKHSISSKMF